MCYASKLPKHVDQIKYSFVVQQVKISLARQEFKKKVYCIATKVYCNKEKVYSAIKSLNVY